VTSARMVTPPVALFAGASTPTGTSRRPGSEAIRAVLVD
jgi:hypothetical protein